MNGRAGSDLEISPFCECVLSCMWVDSSVSQGEVSNCIKVYLKVCLKSRCMCVSPEEGLIQVLENTKQLFKALEARCAILNLDFLQKKKKMFFFLFVLRSKEDTIPLKNNNIFTKLALDFLSFNILPRTLANIPRFKIFFPPNG